MIKDLRNNHDESALFDWGDVYRKGQTLQVWWKRNALGEPFDNSKADFSRCFDGTGRETWTFPPGVDVAARFKAFIEENNG